MEDQLQKVTISRKKLLGIAGLGWMFDAMDVGMLSFIIVALKNDWGLSAEQVGLIGSMNSIGMAIGAFLFGIMADKVGRRNIFIVTLLFFSIASGLSALSTTFIVFVILRFFIGLGLGGELPVASTYVSELVPAHKRGQTVVLLESFWAFGWLVAALISYFIIPSYGWRIALLISAVPAFYAIYLRIKLPNSSVDTAVKTSSETIGQKIKKVWSKSNRKATITLWVLWFSVVFSYYGMFLWLPTVMVMKGFHLIQSFQYVLIMTLAQLPGYFSAAWLIERAGRKFVLITFLLGTAISAYFFGQAQSTEMLMTSGLFLSFFNLGAWGALYAYTPEQYESQIRGTGAGMAASFGRIGGIFGPFFVGYLIARNYTFQTIFLWFAIAIVIGAIFVLLFGKETKERVQGV